MKPAPILLFTYNRLRHTQNTIDSILKNKLAAESDLFVFSDAPKTDVEKEKVQSVRNYIAGLSGFASVTVVHRKENFGLGKNIIAGVTEIVEKKGTVIVLEDDLIVSPYFLEYMNQGLEVYRDEPSVISIHGYVYPVKKELPETLFIKGADCLGWATWKRGWALFEKDGSKLLQQLTEANRLSEFDFDNTYPFVQMLRDQIAGKNTSWAVRWYASAFLLDMYTLYPGKSLIFHAGGDGSGTNTGFNTLLDVKLTDNPVAVNKQPVIQNMLAYQEFQHYYRLLTSPGLMYRIKTKLKTIFKK